MMNDELRRAACQEDIDEDALFRPHIESVLADAGGISSKELQTRVDKIIKICAECGITEEQIYAILAACEPPSLEATVRQIKEAEKALHKAIGAEAAKLMDGFGEVYRKSRRRWGWKHLRKQLTRYTPPVAAVKRKKKHGRESWRKL